MKNITCLFLTICTLLLLASCGEQPEISVPEPTPTSFTLDEVTFTKTSVLLSEAHDSVGAPYGLNKSMEICEYGGFTYAFEPQIPYEERAECIQVTKAISDRVGVGGALRVNIYSPDTYDCTFVENGSIFTCVQDWNAPEYTVSLLYGLLGEYSHYGALYGYANYLNSELDGSGTPVYSEMPKPEDGHNFLDLNLLCFRPEFVSVEEIECAQQLANAFVQEYIASHGEEEFLRLMEKSGGVEGAAEFRKVLSDFYASKGIDYTPTDMIYRSGGKGYDYIVKCAYAVMYVEKDWVDKNKDMCPYTYDNFLHENYDDVKQYFTINVGEFEQFRELFGLYPYDDDLNIYFTNHPNIDSRYLANTHSILIQNTASLGHEYIHSLTNEHNIMEYWAMEGFARYFSYYYNYYGNAMGTVDFNAIDWKYIQEYKADLGRDIDMNTDYAQVYHLMAYCNSYDDPNDAYGYVAGASFIDYLISRLGEKEAIEIICVTHDFGEYSYEELVADWQAYLTDNYAQYTKIR